MSAGDTAPAATTNDVEQVLPAKLVKTEELDARDVVAALRQSVDPAAIEPTQAPAPETATTAAPSPSPSTSTARGTVLFADAASFPSDERFFQAVSDALLAQYGVRAVPSKREETKVSARCARNQDKHGGCPFRVCAAKRGNGQWVVRLPGCTWEHSHAPGPPQAATASTSSAPPASALPAPVYPARDATFATAIAAYQAYVRALVRALGVSAVLKDNGGRSARILCNRKKIPQQARCGFNVLLRLDEALNEWSVDHSASNHEHNHGPHPQLLACPAWIPRIMDDNAREAMGLPPLGAATAQTAPRSPASATASPPATPAPAPPARAVAPKGPVRVPAGLPGRSDVFSSLDAVWLAYVKAYVPSWGIGVFKLQSGASSQRGQIRCNRNAKPYLCPWTAVVEMLSPGRVTVAFARSKLVHNHGPHPNILADPSWRPAVLNKDARRALGMDAPPAPASQSSATKKRPPSPDLPPPPIKKRRSASPPPASSSRPPPSNQHAAPNGPRSSSSLREHPPSPFPSPSPAPNAPLAPSATPTSARPSSPALASFRAFLHALHPSTTPLAPHLLSAGLSTPEDLAALLLLSPPVFNRFVEELSARVDAAGRSASPGEAVSLVQMKLFAVKMREARAGLAKTG